MNGSSIDNSNNNIFIIIIIIIMMMMMMMMIHLYSDLAARFKGTAYNCET